MFFAITLQHRIRTLFAVCSLMVFCCFPAVSLAGTDAPASLLQMRTLLEEKSNVEALSMGLQLRDQAERTGDRTLELEVIEELARFYIDNGSPQLGLETVNEGLALTDKATGDTMLGALSLTKTMALIRVGQFENGNVWAKRVLAIAESIGDQDLLGRGTYMLASTLARLNQPDDAQIAYREAAAILRASDNVYWSSRAMNDLAMINKFRAKFDEAEAIFLELLTLAESRSDLQMEVYALLELGDIQRLTGNLSEAKQYLLRARQIAYDEENPAWQVFAHSYLADLYRALGDDDEALKHTNELALYQGTMQAENAVARIAELEFKRMATAHAHQMEILDKERELAELTATRGQAFLVAVLLGVTLLLILLVWLYRGWRQQSAANARLRASNLKLDHAARTDALTGLANRHALNERLKWLEKNKTQYSLILLDLDHFKLINDNFGHDHGDAVLIEVSQRVKARLRQADLAVRWGGEEFLVLLTDASRKQTHDVAQQLYDQIRKRPIVVQGEAHFITATFGIATLSGHDSFQSALRGADQALVAGKKSGRDKIAMQDTSETGTSRAINLVA